MIGRGQRKKGTLHKARVELDKRGGRIADLERAQSRIGHLYEISKLMTRFPGTDHAVPELVALVAKTVPLRNAIFILDLTDSTPVFVWNAVGEGEDRLSAAKSHAENACRYLFRSHGPLEHDRNLRRELPKLRYEDSTATAEPRRNFVFIPLVVDAGRIFGALQLGGAGPLNEQDLGFINAVVNQLAIAIDRQAGMDAKQLEAEVSANEQRLLAEVSVVVGASLHYSEILAALARFAVPRLADLCIIDELHDDGSVLRLQVVFADPQKQVDLVDRLLRVASGSYQFRHVKAITSGIPILVPKMTESIREGLAVDDPERASVLHAIGVESMIVVPLVTRGRTMGVVVLAALGSGRRFSRRDLDLVQEIARRTAAATDNAQLYAQAQRATLARENLLAIVSHDMKSLLSSILMGLALLKNPDRDRRQWQVHLERTERSARRMNRLIDDLLDTASIDAGRLSIQPQLVTDMRVLIFESLEIARPSADRKLIYLRSDVPFDLPAVFADAARLQQVLGNLLDNAIKFTPQGGTISVRAVPSPGSVTFSVEDSGPGIPQEELPHLFDRFWQAARTATLGRGLGLFIAKGIIEAHTGKLWVESELGSGSRFFFTVPTEPIVAGSIPVATPHSGRPTAKDGPQSRA